MGIGIHSQRFRCSEKYSMWKGIFNIQSRQLDILSFYSYFPFSFNKFLVTIIITYSNTRRHLNNCPCSEWHMKSFDRVYTISYRLVSFSEYYSIRWESEFLLHISNQYLVKLSHLLCRYRPTHMYSLAQLMKIIIFAFMSA